MVSRRVASVICAIMGEAGREAVSIQANRTRLSLAGCLFVGVALEKRSCTEDGMINVVGWWTTKRWDVDWID